MVVTTQVKSYAPRPGEGYRKDETVLVIFSNGASAILTRREADKLIDQLCDVLDEQGRIF